MNFHPIDMENWGRKPYFAHYMHAARCTFSMSANINITPARFLADASCRL
ncbi:hypothetical protein J27TS7_57990 [Paenibacillus dendritiformis]|nr:hypothetical protein J27TS7_57990 [Paenibacillus dendritiformis]